MIDKFGNEFEFEEKETGFSESAEKVFKNSKKLMIIGYNPDGENQLMVASNMTNEVALHIINSLQSALGLVESNGN